MITLEEDDIVESAQSVAFSIRMIAIAVVCYVAWDIVCNTDLEYAADNWAKITKWFNG